MLVLSRTAGESLLINDELLRTVIVVGRDFIEIVITPPTSEKQRPMTLGVNQRMDLPYEVSIIVIRIADGKVRLGIDYPKDVKIERL